MLDAELVRCLLREQFPQWAHHRVRPVELDGWDNRTFRVGQELSARLPSGDGYSAQVDKEQRWLPLLAPSLPLPIPVPVARGRPGCGFPRPWSVYRWLPGAPARADLVEDSVGFARDLAGFLTALQAIGATGGPVAGAHSWGRGGSLVPFDEQTRCFAEELGGVLDVRAVLELWEAALAVPSAGAPVWVHGDVTASNLLVDGGRLSAVIDFGCCAVGDPACDLVVAWTFLSGQARHEFRQALPLAPDVWARARGWALWKALLAAAEPDEVAVVRRQGWRCGALDMIHDLLTDHEP